MLVGGFSVGRKPHGTRKSEERLITAYTCQKIPPAHKRFSYNPSCSPTCRTVHTAEGMQEIQKAHAIGEPVFTPSEIAADKKLHPSTVRKMFVDEEGVIRIGHPGSRQRAQRYTLRIPASVVQRVFGRMTVGAGDR